MCGNWAIATARYPVRDAQIQIIWQTLTIDLGRDADAALRSSIRSEDLAWPFTDMSSARSRRFLNGKRAHMGPTSTITRDLRLRLWVWACAWSIRYRAASPPTPCDNKVTVPQ